MSISWLCRGTGNSLNHWEQHRQRGEVTQDEAEKKEAKSSSGLTKDIDIILGQQEDCSEA